MKSSMTSVDWSWIRITVEYIVYVAVIALVIATLNSTGS
jgi:hypothetical protein